MARAETSAEMDRQTLLAHADTDAFHNDEHLSQFQHLKSKLPTKRILLPALLIALFATLSLSVLLYSRKTASTLHHTPCGSTPEQAASLGCKFDVLTFSWQRPECFFEDIHERYWKKAQEHGPLRLYADPAYTTLLPADPDVYKRTPKVWAEHRFHLLHCMYCFETMHRAAMEGRPVAEPVASWNHTVHCAAWGALESFEVRDTDIDLGYYRCVNLR